MSNINAKLEVLQAAQVVLRTALYDFQETLLDSLEGTNHYYRVDEILEESGEHLNALVKNTNWAASYM